MDDEFDPTEDDAETVIVLVSANPETWMPMVVFAMQADPIEIKDGYLSISLSSREGMNLGSSIIQAATVVANMEEELAEKSVEERREILILESQYVGPDSPGE